jgi:hypothetical protein
MAGGGDTLKRYLTSVFSHMYIRQKLTTAVGRPCTTNGRNVNAKEATGEEVEGRRPDRPRSKWLEKVSKDDGSTGIRR